MTTPDPNSLSLRAKSFPSFQSFHAPENSVGDKMAVAATAKRMSDSSDSDIETRSRREKKRHKKEERKKKKAKKEGRRNNVDRSEDTTLNSSLMFHQEPDNFRIIKYGEQRHLLYHSSLPEKTPLYFRFGEGTLLELEKGNHTAPEEVIYAPKREKQAISDQKTPNEDSGFIKISPDSSVKLDVESRFEKLFSNQEDLEMEFENVEESSDSEYIRRVQDINKRLASDKKNLSLWLEYVSLQDLLINETMSAKSKTGMKVAVIEKKLAILEQAMEEFDEDGEEVGELITRYMECAEEIWEQLCCSFDKMGKNIEKLSTKLEYQ
ncbi:hypothetical protein HK096_003680 [Nowakowskiella sp. JEL0078]|nr:hypothetical protein HK096_003680 [Nowakowskiella sp. JEL0078]